jgi:hypothetical protein
MTITILSGHVSPETAFVVSDYPYSFKLRCSIRYWLDCDAKKGARLMSQTTNPKKPGTVWNKPKASTYARFAGCMFLDDNGHVSWSGLTEYTDGAQAVTWREIYGAGCPALLVPVMDDWIRSKLAYDKLVADGKIRMTVTVTQGERVL